MPSDPTVRAPHLGALLLVTGTTALSTDTYLSSLPALQTSLHTSSSLAQLTVTAFIVGMAVGQLVAGPLSDARGRRGLILGACLVFTVTAALCAVATVDWVLVAERTVQGIAAGTALAVGRAVVNDTQTGRAAAAMFGTLSAVGLIAPVVGPAVGGVLVSVGDWRTVFWFLASVGVLMVLAATFGLPETLPPARRHPGGLANFGRRTADLLTDRQVVTPIAVQCLTVAGFFVYIGGSSFVLQDDLGITPATYTAVFSVNALAMVTASAAFRILVVRVGAVVLRRVAIATQTTGVAALFVLTLTAPDHRPPLGVVWACLAVMTAGLGLYYPSNATIVQHAGRRAAGTASALGGGLPFLAGAFTTPLTGLLGHQTVMTMAACMIVFFVLAAVVAVLGRGTTLDPDAQDPDAQNPTSETIPAPPRVATTTAAAARTG
ncbi:multidrug effflux MFS transporter [Jatrophihabitans sp. YIM 134969]